MQKIVAVFILLLVVFLTGCTTRPVSSNGQVATSYATGYGYGDVGISVSPCTPPKGTEALATWAKALDDSYESRTMNVTVSGGMQQCSASQSAGSHQRAGVKR